MSLDQVETGAPAQPGQERAKLAQRLLESLDALSEAEHEAQWRGCALVLKPSALQVRPTFVYSPCGASPSRLSTVRRTA
ncbi:hypothetical protein ACFJGW_03435 [Burkholderiaceae bacterium UC74_6]